MDESPSAAPATSGVRTPVKVGLVAAAALGVVIAGSVVAFGGDDAALVEGAMSSDGTRVLQSVDVGLASDGTLDSVSSTVVSTDAEGNASTQEGAFSPAAVADQLPVRLLTSYRTESSSGTDLSDLEGHTGPVDIDLTVQNLTVRPQEVTYDADGRSRSQNALVGVPLSITASTVLQGVDPSAITLGEEGDDDATNGVAEPVGDDTQVQWATILAPPQLGSGTRLSLSLDAEDLAVPEFRVSVQPGLVTDPSIGALIDAAFNPQRSEEMALQLRTIELLGDVDEVLTEASETITEVSSTLETSREAIGGRMISNLESSTGQLQSTLGDVNGRVTALGGELSGTLSASQDQTLATFAQAVSSVDALIGDTSVRRVPRPTLDAEGCATEVTAADAAGGVYGDVLRIASLLTGYADATEACRQEVREEIGESAAELERVVTKALESVADAGTALTKDVRDATSALRNSSAGVGGTFDLLAVLLGQKPAEEGEEPSLARIQELLEDGGTLDSRLGDVRAALASIRELAGRGRDAVDDLAGEQATLLQSQRDVAAELCTLVGDQEAGTLSADQVDDLREDLGFGPCPLPDEPADEAGAVDDRAQELLEQLVTATDARGSEIARALDAVDQAREDAYEEVRDGGAGSKNLVGLLERVLTEGRKLLGAVDEQALASIEGGLKKADDAFETARGEADGNARRIIGGATTANATRLSDLLLQASSGLTGSAADVVGESRRSLAAQRGDFGEQIAGSAQSVGATIEAGLGAIESGTAASARDTEAASRLLTADLADLLVDIGDPRGTGSGLLGAMGTSAATAESAETTVSLAAGQASSYGNARGRDVQGILLRQAQARAALERQAELPPFALELQPGAQHRTVYSLVVGGAS